MLKRKKQGCYQHNDCGYRERIASFSLLCLSVLTGALMTLPSGAAEPDVSAGGVPEQLSNFEKKFFFQTYQHDPIEKRLQRLELLFFGATQAGTNLDRWARVKEAIAERGKSEKQQEAGAATGMAPVAKEPLSAQAKYPVVTTLENKICKQSYPNEPIGERLSRLETKVFGQSAPGIPLADRVERLKKMIGAGEAEMTSQPFQLNRRYGLGPLPKAQPRMPGSIPDEPYMPPPFGMSPFGSPFGGNSPFVSPFGMMPPFGDDDLSEMNKKMNDMFSQLNRQLRDLKKLPPGQQMDPYSPYLSPDGSLPGFKTFPFPLRKFPGAPKEPELPPYTDPNSI